ncbi:MAG: hypothetical protein JWO54_488 [Candidatus Saccharibacteria bacterium]|nr:hypothetical protein [Candidatus Saccharibacteria bacterium]
MTTDVSTKPLSRGQLRIRSSDAHEASQYFLVCFVPGVSAFLLALKAAMDKSWEDTADIAVILLVSFILAVVTSLWLATIRLSRYYTNKADQYDHKLR